MEEQKGERNYLKVRTLLLLPNITWYEVIGTDVLPQQMKLHNQSWTGIQEPALLLRSYTLQVATAVAWAPPEAGN